MGIFGKGILYERDFPGVDVIFQSRQWESRMLEWRSEWEEFRSDCFGKMLRKWVIRHLNGSNGFRLY